MACDLELSPGVRPLYPEGYPPHFTDHVAFPALSQIVVDIIIVIIIIILGISFMQGIYTYIPETNHVPREQCVATILV